MINQKIIDIAHKFGMDKSVAYSSGSRIVQGFTGVVSVFFITTFLSGVEQASIIFWQARCSRIQRDIARAGISGQGQKA